MSISSRLRRDLRATRLYYLIALGGAGFIFPFLPLFYVRQGLNGLQIGWVSAAASLVALGAAPLWTNQSEKSARPRRLLQLSIFLVAVSYLWLSQQTLFWGILLVTVARVVVGAGMYPMSDGLALSVSGATRAGFGSVRLWASVGWAISVLLGGWLIERFSLHIAFWNMFLVTSLGALVLSLVSGEHFVRHAEVTPPVAGGLATLKASAPGGLKSAVRDVLHNPALFWLAIMLVAAGLGNSGVMQFETIYLDVLGASESVIGVASMVSAVVEVPSMLWADVLVRKHGPRRLLLLAMAMYVVLRCLVLAFPAVATIILVRAIGGIALSFYSVALIRYIGEQSRPGQTRTSLALFNVTLTGLVAILGNPLAGWFYDLFGARWLYAIAALGYGLGWLSLRRNREENLTG